MWLVGGGVRPAICSSTLPTPDIPYMKSSLYVRGGGPLAILFVIVVIAFLFSLMNCVVNEDFRKENI
jgi:hypothetical protein